MGTSVAQINAAFSLDQAEGSRWFNGPVSDETFIDKKTDDLRLDLEQRYVECLWLGEYHTSLSDMVEILCHTQTKEDDGLSNLMVQLASILRARSYVKSRYNDTTTFNMVHELATLHFDRNMATPSCFSAYELGIISIALQGGPGFRIKELVNVGNGNTSATYEDSSFHSLTTRWLKAMESRELQLQIIITMYLLKLVADRPAAMEQARRYMQSNMETTENETESKQTVVQVEPRPKKRSRKPDNPKRWIGANTASLDTDDFLWSRKPRSRKATDRSQDDDARGDSVLEMSDWHVLDAEHLTRRLDALTDILCLDQITSGLLLDLGSSLFGHGPNASPTKSAALGDSNKNHSASITFGSAARPTTQDEELDQVQWLCVKVVEPYFRDSLPRQCSMLRSKCFVPGVSTTNLHLSDELPSPPPRVLPLASAVAADEFPISKMAAKDVSKGRIKTMNADLSDALKQEQALGRRPSRGAAQGVVGKGREVDMNRKFSRSISAGSRLLGIQSNSAINSQETQSNFTRVPVGSKVFVTGRPGKRKSEAIRRTSATLVQQPTMHTSDSVGSRTANGGKTRQTLVLSTPQKNRTITIANLTQRPALHLFRRSESQPSWIDANRGRLSPDWSRGLSSQSYEVEGQADLLRSPSPVALAFDTDDDK